MINYGVGAEVAATIQDGAFLRLEAPVKRVAGWSIHTGLQYEKFIMPDITSESGSLSALLCMSDRSQGYMMQSSKRLNISPIAVARDG